MEYIDITNGVFNSEVYPGDPVPMHRSLRSIENGDGCNLSIYATGAHAGTHVDAPLHFVDNGDTIDKLPLAPFIGPCCVIEVPEGPITGEYVENYFPRSSRRVLIKSSGRAWFLDHGAYAAANLEYFLVGTDALSVGCEGNQVIPHKAFLNNGIALLEGLDLSEVQPGNYFLIAPPIKLEGLEAAPARAILIRDHFSWNK